MVHLNKDQNTQRVAHDTRTVDQRFAGTTCTRMGIALKGTPLPSVGEGQGEGVINHLVFRNNLK